VNICRNTYADRAEELLARESALFPIGAESIQSFDNDDCMMQCHRGMTNSLEFLAADILTSPLEPVFGYQRICGARFVNRVYGHAHILLSNRIEQSAFSYYSFLKSGFMPMKFRRSPFQCDIWNFPCDGVRIGISPLYAIKQWDILWILSDRL
jgi:hypothetical protein